MSLHVYINTIPHAEQRYPTVGDYQNVILIGRKSATEIHISEMENEDYEFLVAVHELVESYLCKKRDVSIAEIDAFDIAFEAARPPGNTDEPGDSLDAPYHKEHVFATWIERLVAQELGINWDEYEDKVTSL